MYGTWGTELGIIAGAPPRADDDGGRSAGEYAAIASHVAATPTTIPLPAPSTTIDAASSHTSRHGGGSVAPFAVAALASAMLRALASPLRLLGASSSSALRPTLPASPLRLLGASRNMASLQRYKPEFNNSWLGSRPWLYSRELKRVHKDDYVPKQHLKRVTARREEKRLARRAFREEVALRGKPADPGVSFRLAFADAAAPWEFAPSRDALTATLVGRFPSVGARGWAAGVWRGLQKGGGRVTLGGLEFRRGDVRAAAES